MIFLSNMLNCGKYFPPRATLFPDLNFTLTIRELQNQLLQLKRTSASNSVGAALLSLQQELAKPPPVFDPYKALAGLESLVDLAWDNADARTKRFSMILRQCCPLLGKPQFKSILLKLVGDKEGESYPEVPAPSCLMGAQYSFASAWSRFLPQVS